MLALTLTAVALTAILRAVAPLSLQLRKPLACDLCMSFWCGLFVAGLEESFGPPHLTLAAFTLWALRQALPVIGAAYALTSTLSWLRDTRGGAPLPPLEPVLDRRQVNIGSTSGDSSK